MNHETQATEVPNAPAWQQPIGSTSSQQWQAKHDGDVGATGWGPPGQSAEANVDWPVDYSTPGKTSGSGWLDTCSGDQYTGQWHDLASSSEGEDEEMDVPEGEVTDTVCDGFYAAQVSEAEYQQQTKEYTRAAVDALIQSPEYQRKVTRCRLCWSIWYEGQWSEGCLECGGFAMERPCGICLGRCGSCWKRDVDMSHSHNEAHWMGECQLPPDERAGFLAQRLMEGDDGGNEDAMIEGLTDLKTS